MVERRSGAGRWPLRPLHIHFFDLHEERWGEAFDQNLVMTVKRAHAACFCIEPKGA